MCTGRAAGGEPPDPPSNPQICPRRTIEVEDGAGHVAETAHWRLGHTLQSRRRVGQQSGGTGAQAPVLVPMQHTPEVRCARRCWHACVLLPMPQQAVARGGCAQRRPPPASAQPPCQERPFPCRGPPIPKAAHAHVDEHAWLLTCWHPHQHPSNHPPTCTPTHPLPPLPSCR